MLLVTQQIATVSPTPADLPTPTVVFVNRFFFPDESATSRVLTDMATALAARRLEVHVVCSRQRHDDPSVALAPEDRADGVSVHRIATTRFGRRRIVGRAADYLTFYAAATFRLLRLLRSGDVLIVKTDPPLMSLPAVLIAALTGAALVTWQQDVFPEVASRLGTGILPRWLASMLVGLRNASLRRAAMNVAIGSRMREFLISNGIADSRVRLIENCVDTDAIQPKAVCDSRLRRRIGVEDRFVVCYSGNLGRAHEFDTLLDAARELAPDPGFVFLIIGGGAKLAALKRAVTDAGLLSFRFLPYQPREDLADCLAAGDVHLVSLLPAMEGLIVPSKLYGILAAGRPVLFIGDQDGEVGRTIGAAACGLSVDVGDSAGLVRSLRTFRDDAAMRDIMGLRARQLACASYGLPGAVDRWLDVLMSCAVTRLQQNRT